jgi:hypothetical protein
MTAPRDPPAQTHLTPAQSPARGSSSAGWFVEVVRWLLVPVAAIGAMLVVTMIGRLFVPRLVAEPGGITATASPLEDMQRIVVRTLIAIGASGALVMAGSKMAPRNRRASAVVLAVLTIGYALLAHIVVHWGRGYPNWIDFSLSAIAALLAAAYIASTEH